MSALKLANRRKIKPTWEVAALFPAQGEWDENDYLTLSTNHLIELSDGRLEVLPMPGDDHQSVVFFLAKLLDAFATSQRLGKVLVAPLPIQLWPGKMREPDVAFLLAANMHRRRKQYWLGADLVMEVVSPDDPGRDWVKKRQEYAQAGIPEYWIIDPRKRKISVLHLEEGAYVVSGEYGPGEQALSVLLAGFGVDVVAVFAAAD